MGTLLETGQLFAGRYKVLNLLGKGGFGEVYRACQVAIPRDVALKVIRADEDDENRAVLERFRREAQHISQLQHPNTITLFDYGDCDGIYYIAMEVLEGQNLAEMIERTGPLSVGRALHIFEQTLRSLSEAHSRGIVHRDLKPENIFVLDIGAERDVVKVLDFGIARAAGQDAHLERLTIAGTVVGTPYYMAPEQALGWDVAPWTDVYAMGLILYEMLTGVQAVSGSTIYSVLNMQVSSPTPTLPEPLATSALNTLIQRACIKQAEERFRDAQKLLDALRAIPDLGSLRDFTLPPRPQPSSKDLSASSLLAGLLGGQTQDHLPPENDVPAMHDVSDLEGATVCSSPLATPEHATLLHSSSTSLPDLSSTPTPPQRHNRETQLLQPAEPVVDAALRTHIFSSAAPPLQEPSSCIGRGDVLETLATLVDDVTLTGKAQLAFVTASLGQGRSTLLEAFERDCKETGIVPCVRATQISSSTPLSLLRDVVSTLLEPDNDPDEVLFALSQNLLGEHAHHPDLGRFLVRFFDPDEPTPDPTSLLPNDLAGLFQALERFLLEATSLETLCIVLDDLHLLDELTVQFIGYFLSSIDLQTQPLALVVSFCTDPLFGEPAILRAFERLALDRGLQTTYTHVRPLSKAHAKHLVHSITRVSDNLFEALWTQTHGNPWFLTRATHHACSSEHVTWDGVAWSLAPDAALTLPPEISTHILESLHWLFPPTTPQTTLYISTLQWIATLGDEVDKRTLVAVLRKDPRIQRLQDLDTSLDDLTHLGLLHRIEHGRSELLSLPHPLIAAVLRDALLTHPNAPTILRAGQRFLPPKP